MNICQSKVRHCRDAKIIYTVSDSIARKYEKYLGLKADSILVTYNAPFHDNGISVTKTSDSIKLVTAGLADPQRKLELMIEAMRRLPLNTYTLDMYLVNVNRDYMVYLEKMAKEAGNVYIKAPVEYTEIVKTLNLYDVFLCVISPSNYSLKYSLPNKFFEAVQGRLAIVIGPSPEMKRVLDTFKLGVCSDDFKPESIAKAISMMSKKQIDQFKANSDKNAIDLCAEKAMETIRQIVKDAI